MTEPEGYATTQEDLSDGRRLLSLATALERGFEALAAQATDQARRAILARVAGRLAASVVRPLTGAVGKTITPGDAPPAATESQLMASLYELACDATRLRVRLGRPLTLLEAVAALQDLACQAVAGDADELASRRESLAALQEDLPGSIQSALGGPYLVTNIGRLTDWLGQSLDPMPQMALCRCGVSQLKPWCDGSHAQLHASDAKSEDRVADRLDRYPARGITVFDNRAICADSRLCSDRLPNVFHAESVPFVTASGGRLDEIIRAVRDCPSGALGFALDGIDAAAQADQNREPAIEVSKDGPYRVTGSVPLLDGLGQAERQGSGASTEHYSLCRCGQSQDKPFCSGRHRSTGFADPPAPERATLFEWAGGFPALLRLTRRFYEAYVPEDPLLAPLFARMSPDHPHRVSAWLGEVFGGPKAYSSTYGGYQRMLSQHADKDLQEEWRARWVRLLCRAADDVGLPADPEFRAAFVAYLEWGSRIALENSRPDAAPPPRMPVPRWWWVCDAYPWTRPHGDRPVEPDAATTDAAQAQPSDVDEEEPQLPDDDEVLSFAAHIKPLFRERDRNSMTFAFDLWSYDDVAQHAEAIQSRLAAGTMPCDGRWPADRVAVFERWIATGKPR